jgi:hypothetical protein
MQQHGKKTYGYVSSRVLHLEKEKHVIRNAVFCFPSIVYADATVTAWHSAKWRT